MLPVRGSRQMFVTHALHKEVRQDGSRPPMIFGDRVRSDAGLRQESSWGLAAWGSSETWPAGRLRVVTGRRCWRQVCCPCAWAGAVTGSRVAGGGGAVHLVRRFLV